MLVVRPRVVEVEAAEVVAEEVVEEVAIPAPRQEPTPLP